MNIALVVPHMFMHRDVLPRVIFSPGELALALAAGLERSGVTVTLYTPGPVDTLVRNVTADLTGFEAELKVRGDTYVDLLKKHPLVFVSLARSVQSEIVARAFASANAGEHDVVHIYANEEDVALPFARFCKRPVVFTHHDPFDFLVRYRRNYPHYKALNWISMSLAQRNGMPADTNWVANIYHGLDPQAFKARFSGDSDYALYLGRMIESKGVHLAISAVREYNRTADRRLRLVIAGKHYSGNSKHDYWATRIEPEIDGVEIEYRGFVRGEERAQLLAGARALVAPSTFNEPFGMVLIEALASGTPVVGLANGAIPEVVRDGETGFVVGAPEELAGALARIGEIDRRACRADFEARFTLDRMVAGHLAAYRSLL